MGEDSAERASEGGFRVAVGTKVYVPCPKAVWATAEVIAVDADGLISAKLDDGDSVVQLKKDEAFYLCNTDEWNLRGLCAPDDLTSLTHLHEAAVLDSLSIRFELDMIYTFTGPILIAVNPFKPIKGLYDMQAMKHYILQGESEEARATDAEVMEDSSSPLHDEHARKGREPHVFATSAAAYRGLCSAMKSQTILISGESGAGKTESTKFVMSFLACAGSDRVDERSTVERQVLESNPLLEAFGNARTLRNDNSSRFGKFIELQFEVLAAKGSSSKRARLCGARIKTYLLEKVRVCQQQEGERNYHIFYQLCAAAARAKTSNGCFQLSAGRATSKASRQSSSEEEGLFSDEEEDGAGKEETVDLSAFEAREQYKLLTCSSCYRLQGVDDCAEFERTLTAFRTLGISWRRIKRILAVVGAVLWLGNATFEGCAGDAESSQPSVASLPCIARAGELLGVQPEALTDAMCFRTIKANKETYKKPLRPSEASEMRSSLCRALYGRLFLRVVDMANKAIACQHSIGKEGAGAEDGLLFCGVLDIFGFECFGVNSFEQLCINYSNERLQQFFNLFVFSLEQKLYNQEGVPWDELSFPCNDECVKLLEEKPFGVFSLLDEECAVPGGKARGFCTKLTQRQQKHPCFATVKTRQQEAFIIRHFAGAVQYDTDGFLEKNRDQLSNDLVECLVLSREPFVKALFEADAAALSGDAEKKTAGAVCTPASGTSSIFRRRGVTVSGEFRQQLGELMNVIASTTPHFIRCVRPNPSNVPDVFDRPSVNEQLRYGGVLQAVQVSRAGYPVRVPHAEAFKDYKCLASPALQQQQRHLLLKASEERTEPNWKSLAKDLLLDIASRLPLSAKKKKQKGGASSESEARPEDCGWAVGATLCFFKKDTFELLSAYLTALKTVSATKVQAQYKGWATRRRFLEIKSAAVVVQKNVRGWLARRELRRLREAKSAQIIQSYWRMAICEKKYNRARRALVLLQRTWRQQRNRRVTAQLHSHLAAARIQATWRMFLCRRSFLKAKDQARRIQLWWRRQLPRRLLRRLRAEAQSTAAMMELIASLRVDLKDAKQKVQEEALHSDQLQATVEELQRQLTKLKAENVALRRKLEAAESRALKRGCQISQAKSLLRSQVPELAVATSSRHAQSLKSAASRSSSLSGEESNEDFPNGGTTPSSLISLLNRSLALAAEKGRDAVRSEEELKLQLCKVQSKLAEETALRERAEAKCKLLLQDAAGAPGGSDPTCCYRHSTRQLSTLPQQSLLPFNKAGLPSTRARPHFSLDGRNCPPHPEVYDKRFVDLLLVYPTGVAVRELVRDFARSVGDSSALEVVEGGESQGQGGGGETEKLVKIKLDHEGGTWLCGGASSEAAADGSLKCLSVLSFKLTEENQRDAVTKRAQQSFVCGAVFDPAVPESLQTALAIATDLLIPAVRSAAEAAPELPPSQVYVLECLDTRDGHSGRSADFNTEHVIDFVASKGCHYKALSSLSALVKDLVPFLSSHHRFRHISMLRRSEGVENGQSALAVSEREAESSDRLATGSRGATWESFSSKYFNTIRNFLQFPSREGSRTGVGGRALGSSSQKKVAALPLLIPSAVAAPGVEISNELQVVPVGEFSSSEEGGAVTYIVFAERTPSPDFIYLAVGRKDGVVSTYKCFRTALEVGMMGSHGGFHSSTGLESPVLSHEPPALLESDSPHVDVRRASDLVEEVDKVQLCWKQKCHKRAVTCLMYTANEEFLASTSIDCTTRIWNAATGEVRLVFVDRTAVLFVTAMPFDSKTFIISSASETLRSFCIRSGKVLQKMKLRGEARAMCFDDTGLFCFMGTKGGEIAVLETTDDLRLNMKSRYPIGKAAITCLVFVPSRSSRDSPRLLVNCADNTIAVIECVFGQPPGTLTNLKVIQRVKTSHSQLPLRCCYVPNGFGWVVSGSEDTRIICHPLSNADKSRVTRPVQLRYHEARRNAAFLLAMRTSQHPVLVVAVNKLGTLIASGDSAGNIVLWRQLASAEPKLRMTASSSLP